MKDVIHMLYLLNFFYKIKSYKLKKNQLKSFWKNYNLNTFCDFFYLKK